MAKAFAWSLAHSHFPCFTTTKESVSLVSPIRFQASLRLKSALCLSAPHLGFGRNSRGRTPSGRFFGTPGGRFRDSHRLSGFQPGSQSLRASLQSRTPSQLGAKEGSQELQIPNKSSFLDPVVPAPVKIRVETKSPPPAQLEKPSGAASGGAAAVQSALLDPPPGFKRCIECKRAKLLIDFPTSVNSTDGLNDNCRACLGVFRAKRGGRELGHLGLSVEEAWHRAKTCSMCQVSKEIRDFMVKKEALDGLQHICRGCNEVCNRRRPEWPPVNHPLKCDKCFEVKPADEFALKRKARTGRQASCRRCLTKRREELQRLRAAAIYIKRERKVCKICKESRELSEFSRARTAIDGLCHICRKCLSQRVSSKKGDSVEGEGDRRSAGTHPSKEPDVSRQKEKARDVKMRGKGKEGPLTPPL